MIPSEHQTQAAYFDWVRIKAQSDPRYSRIVAIPNGGHRHIATAVKLKAEGVQPGLPDVFGFVRRGDVPGFAIEFKKLGERLKKEQIAWTRYLLEQGWAVTVAFSFEEAETFTLAYMR